MTLDELEVGREAVRVRTVTDADIAGFADVSGDHNPVHLDEAFAQTTPFKGRIAHGMLSAAWISALIAGELPGPGTIYLQQSLSFRRPVRPGDEVSVRVAVTAIDREKARVTLATTCTVAGKPVVEGEAVVLAPRAAA
jgi:3-hydroxybutyryl-CoA dehydratase